MIIGDNPGGQDPMEFNEETVAFRVGCRIRKIRTEKGLSQAELGKRVGLTADRIQKYENGVRKPKKDLLKAIASALGVSTQALVDPNTTNWIGAMYAFFELENHFNMRIEKKSDDQSMCMCLSVEFREELYEYMEEWYEVYAAMQAELASASSDEEKANILRNYHNWEWNYPRGIVDKMTRELQKIRIKSKIDELQKAYEKLDGEQEE